MNSQWLSQLGTPQSQTQRDIPDNWRHIREEAPAHWVAPAADRPGFWVVGRHRDVLTLARGHDFSSERGNMLTSLLVKGGDPAGGRLMAVMDAPHHSALRSAVQGSEFRDFLTRAPSFVAQRAKTLLDAAIDSGDTDFAAAVSDQMPISVVCQLLGVPPEDEALLLALSKRSLSSDQPHLGQAPDRHVRAELVEYFQLAAANPTPGSLIEAMVQHRDGNGEHALEDVALNCYGILLAGDETTRLTLNALAWTLATQPAVWKSLMTEDVDISVAAEEFLRLATPATHFARVATCEVSFGDVIIAEGDIVSAWLVSANADESAYEEPHTVRLDRLENRHLAFGHGMHYCVGATLARVQIRSVLTELRERGVSVAMAGAPTEIYSSFLRGYATMPVRLSETRRG